MCSLSAFPPPPLKGQRTLCEANSCLVNAPENVPLQNYTEKISNYPKPKVSSDTIRTTVSSESVKNAFIHQEESFFRKAAAAWHESGLIGVLEQFSQNEEKSWSGKLCTWISRRIIASVRWLHSLHGSVYPHLMLTNEDLSTEFAQSSNWLKGPVRAFDWHPHAIKCAVAFHDDSVHIFTTDSEFVPVLKHKLQKGVTDIKWKPFSSSVIAVACHNGILIWQIDPTSLVTRPSSSCMRLLSHKRNEPITSIAWHPDGCLLASASAADTTMNIWDTCLETSVPLRRYGGGGVSLLKWSPDGSRLLAATPSSIFRVWETQKWTCERWSKLEGHCQAACWSPDGSVLLFTNSGDTAVYFLTFNSSTEIKPHTIGGSKLAVPVIDVSEVLVTSGDEELRVGGIIHQMVWDKKGERLAISFRDNSELIAVFRTKVKPSLEISSCGFVRGLPGEYPLVMNFHDAFSDGALLTVCWSSGRIANIVFLFESTFDPSLSLYGVVQNTSDLPTMQKKQTVFSNMQ